MLTIDVIVYNYLVCNDNLPLFVVYFHRKLTTKPKGGNTP
ncbi:hypothetical protein PJIAN_4501 [Paludibacter jiangxiensis]|uniref:Uncharacterized protein n=1 Tax=Paludibacter jiangxiensis TaxID=681398 RepID=A0A171ALY5_9BACT|nr:hypothetical protein PJIAN_4501 [Paludibacter jiangxiensis]